MEPVPVAERLLQTKFFGVPVRRLGQAVAIPLSPALLASLLGLRIGVVGPLLLLGLSIGAVLFYRTPTGQSPFAWIRGGLQWLVGPDTSFWQPIRQEAVPSTWLDWQGATHETRTRTSEDPIELSGGILGHQNTTETLDFDHVRDDGVVVTATGYARILEIEPTPWLILDDASRDSTIEAFERYLAGVGSAIQFVSIPVPFDVEPHQAALSIGGVSTDPEPAVIETGRKRHRQWIGRVVRDGAVRDRRHFLVVSVPTESNSGNFSPLSRRGPDSGSTDSIEELDARIEHARTSLPRTGVELTLLSERSVVLEVLYRYYRGREPPEQLDHGWLTRRGSTEGHDD